MKTHIRVDHLKKTFGLYEAVRVISFSIEQGKLVALLGPSGGGKTTILRMLAGLEEPDEGAIYFHGQRVDHVRPQERGIGFVFQNYALFRHMNVFDNIAFGLTVQRKSRKEIRQRVEELIALTGLSGLEKRYPHQLSGGQKQRVAFARALAPQPQLLLLDEPFAAIDVKVRKELRTWLKNMIHHLGVTTIFVTHDQEEAVEVADEIMIIQQGRLEQKGTPMEVYLHPQTPFVASFIGESMQLNDAAGLRGFASLQAGDQVMIRPEHVEIGREHEISFPPAAEQGVVKQVHFRGTTFHVEVEVGPHRLFTYRSLEREPLQPGESVFVLIHRLYHFRDKKAHVLENSWKRAAALTIQA